ncbi:MAG: PAS domain S-box protein [Deltaproteobacteria bacterium]|nr:PAS domain S-box protein [Deltaproteobacteria bacterium]
MAEFTLSGTHPPRSAEDALRESESRCRFLVDAAPVGIIVHAEGRIVFANEGAAALAGLPSATSLVGREVLDFIHPEDRAVTGERLGNAYAGTPRARTFEVRVLRGDGTILCAAARASSVEWKGGPASQVVLLDITARKDAERRVREQEALLRAVTEPALDAIFAKGLDRRYTFCNPGAERIIGLPADRILGSTSLELFGAENEAVIRELDEANLRGEVVDAVRTLRVPGGDRQLHVIQVPVRGPGGEVTGISGIVRDVTEERRQDRLMRETGERYRFATRAGRVGVWVLYPEELRLLSDGTLQELLGYPAPGPEVAALDGWERTIPRKHRARVLAMVRDLVEGRTRELALEYQTRRSDGTLVWVISKGRAEEGPDGQPVRPLRVFGTTMDISELYDLQEQLRQAQKMEAIGCLAGGIAHDFNNLLTAILGNASLALGAARGQEGIRHHLEGVLYASQRAADLTQQLLAFSRRQMLEPRLIDLNERVERFHEMMERLVGETIQVKLRLAPGISAVRADPGQIEQILANLVVNARDAMPAGGTLTIKTTEVRISRREAQRYPGCKPGRYVLLSVRDTGRGMDDETRGRIFEPFFTTKPQGQGTGLGLSTVWGIVRQHDGIIEVRSRPGAGTVFEIYLPRAEGRPEPVPVAWENQRTPGHGEAVLVVEDEETVRELLRETLLLAGYRVQVARNAGDALAALDAAAEPPALLLTDVVMPGLQGWDLARLVRERHAGIRVLFVSGYTEDIVVRQGSLGEGTRFLRKPFTPQDLQVAVRELLDTEMSRGHGGSP